MVSEGTERRISRTQHILFTVIRRRLYESLFIGRGGGGKEGPDLCREEGQEDGITMIFSPSHLLCTSQIGVVVVEWCEWGPMTPSPPPPPPSSYATGRRTYGEGAFRSERQNPLLLLHWLLFLISSNESFICPIPTDRGRAFAHGAIDPSRWTH